MKIGCIMWSGYIATMAEAARELDFLEMNLKSLKDLEDARKRGEFLDYLENEADVILVLHSGFDGTLDEMLSEVKDKLIISFGYTASHLSPEVSPEQAETIYRYLRLGGVNNLKNALLFIAMEFFGIDIEVEPPAETPWDGIYHPRSPVPFYSIEDYIEWYGEERIERASTIGIIFYKTHLVIDDLEVEDVLIKALEGRGLNVIPVFSWGFPNKAFEIEGNEAVIEKFFMRDGKPIIDLLIDLQSSFLIHTGDRSILEEMDVPIIKGVIVYHRSEDEWQDDEHGLGGELVWSVVMPEFEGIIEPLVAGSRVREEIGGGTFERFSPIEERVSHLADRVLKWVNLRKKPKIERKIVFILHNNPCSGLEANVGGGSNLDTLESVVRILKRMKEEGYSIEDIPADGRELIDRIMDRKAISDFRWTSIDEIVEKGGAICLLDEKEYRSWFDGLPGDVRERMIESWGTPPGKAMVYDGRIVITGLDLGNVLVCTQPKRGCYGARCDGSVCKILHDPDVPPTHQYLATYRFFERVWGADGIVHVGTHGNIEFLPGKSVGLSGSCYPDIAIGSLPHLYIYSVDNPSEGIVAKRRSYATLVDYMLPVMTASGTYGKLNELEQLLGEYELAKVGDHARAHALEHLILEAIDEANLGDEIGFSEEMAFEEVVKITHDAISRIKGSLINKGLHIFGEVPEGEMKVELITSMIRFDEDVKKFFGDDRDRLREAVSGILEGKDDVIAPKVKDVSERIERCKNEIDNLLHGFDGGYIEPGPSGLPTRGRWDVLPTGRNFYTLDPTRIPTRAAWRVGRKLATGLIEKYERETGRIPENCGMILFSTDITWADGEELSQIFYLIGVEPEWDEAGRVNGFRIIPLDELGRPRIDVTVRISGIMRDSFMQIIELLDDAIRRVSELDEPPELNFIRKHALAQANAGQEWSRAATRIFGSKPGTYGAGVNLAVNASAWKDEEDLADVFVYWSGYAYGKGIDGKESHEELLNQLKTVDLSFRSNPTDEHDLFGCCCYFGYHGGLTVAARSLSGKEVKAYHGDTRDPSDVRVTDLKDEIKRVVRTKLLNPKWIEGMKEHGYRGASEISGKVTRVYGWQATTREVDDWVFDDIARTYILDDDMRAFFEENNPYALEEMGRRLLEAYERDLWDPDPEVLNELKRYYLEIEGWIEGRMGGVSGVQGGSIDVFTMEEVEEWKERMEKVKRYEEEV
ncbi:MAG: cobaltochelatase subunit CobN [Candidatus Syntropharchaeales archaeon]